MPKGGARVNSGAAPDPNALARERDAGEWTILPAGERKGTAPSWPLPDPADRELELWAVLWRKPQSLMWDRLSQELEVALYVRRLIEAEQPDSKVTVGTLVRQMADSLGLTTPGMRNNRWKIERVDGASSPAAKAQRESSRTRLKVVRDDDGV